ncbi:MAG: GTPase ObgE [Spirochaetales bacterium]|nr:GTPase ObgE [Spirochaetales bacterium]
MYTFVDEVTLDVASGSGGAGCVSFRREKYIPRGGPDGGDGGRGGDVVFVVQRNLKTLRHLRGRPRLRAGNGSPGEGRQKHGRDGENIEILLPPGVLIKDAGTDACIREFLREGERWVFLEGGIGGKGNTHFKSSRIQAPRFAQPGMPGKERCLKVELNIIADIGFVGFPNAGKSSLLTVLSNARPEVADYPFTTKIPNLGVMSVYERELILADIPGIIEGASRGAGLGLKFLKHISRTAALAFLVDLSTEGWETAFDILLEELRGYSPVLAEKKRILVATKLDIAEAQEAWPRFREKYPDERTIGISAFTHAGLEDLRREFTALASGAADADVDMNADMDAERDMNADVNADAESGGP